MPPMDDSPRGDEEALDALLDIDLRDPEQPSTRRSGMRKGQVIVAVILGMSALVCWGGMTKQQRVTTTLQSLNLQKEFEDKEVVGPDVALERTRDRHRLMLEDDLGDLLLTHVSHRTAHYNQGATRGPDACFTQAGKLFQEVVTNSGLADELQANERSAFKHRFSSAMRDACKGIDSEENWRAVAAKELEQQKPLMTAALAASINDAGLGFQAKMQDWLIHESLSAFPGRLGLLPTPEGQKSVLNRKHTARHAGQLPQNFRAQDKWPQCQDAILRIHNQGHCGSCWAFGGVASLDARMCVATNGTWSGDTDILSRLQVTSCAAEQNGQSDGCQGGLPHWGMVMMATDGIASGSCLPYYIQGEGVDHFQHQDEAPPCVTRCQGGYSLPLDQDVFSSQGAQHYDWITQVHGDAAKILAMKTAIYEEGPVSFAFYANRAFMGYAGGVFSVCTGRDRANHAVYAYGWGTVAGADGDEVEFIEASNSWGPHWGDNGHFRIHPRCVTDVTIPGTIESGVVDHSVGTVDHSVPRDDENPSWPWAQPDECPFQDGCVTDMEGDGPYSEDELCVSNQLNGKKIQVVEFDTEFGYDVLTVNGNQFSGKVHGGFDPSTLSGLTVDSDGIRFTSDFSVNRAGFKICEDTSTMWQNTKSWFKSWFA